MPTERTPAARAKAHEEMITYVRVVAFMERTGNGLGRLALIWASIVIGFSKNLGPFFWYNAAIVFVESFRAFSRESKSDDQLLFRTAGRAKLKRFCLRFPLLDYVNIVTIAVCTSELWVIFMRLFVPSVAGLPLTVGLLVLMVLLSKFTRVFSLPRLIQRMSSRGSSYLLRFIPACALILDTGAILVYPGMIIKGVEYLHIHSEIDIVLSHIQEADFYMRFVLLGLWLFFDIASRVQFPAAHPWFYTVKLIRVLLSLGVLTFLVVVFQFQGFVTILTPLLVGNFQIPLALARIILSLECLFRDFHFDDSVTANLVRTLWVLYLMVLCQGTLYMLACILEFFSLLRRRSLAHSCELLDKSGWESINLYYEHAYDMFVQESVFNATNKMSLVTFAVDSLESDSDVPRDKKLAAVRILHTFLQQGQQQHAASTKIVSEIIASTKAVTTLISMLGWTVPDDADIRLLAAKVIAHLARHLRVVGIAGTMQMVSSLLDVENQPAIEDNSVQRVQGDGGTAGDQEMEVMMIVQVEIRDDSSPRVDGNGGNADDEEIQRDPSASVLDLENTDNQVLTEDSTTQAGCVRDYSYLIWKFCHDKKELWSIPADSFKGGDSFPALGMLILERLAHDLDNCMEIRKATELLPKIIGFISHVTYMTSPQQKQISTSSSRLIAKLASVKGKIGTTLRKDLSDNPFLLGHITELLEDSSSSVEQWKLAMDIIAKLAMCEETRHEIGRIRVILAKLIHVFLGRDESSNTYCAPSLRKAAGQALAMLAMESAGNCSAMLIEPYELIADLTNMVTRHGDLMSTLPCEECEYIAAILLQSMCTHSREEMLHPGPKVLLSSTLPVREYIVRRRGHLTLLVHIMQVLKRIKEAKGKQMEALIGLASKICKLVPESVTPHLESHQDDAAFVQKLVDELNANKRPSAEFPNMRRAVVELGISMVELCPPYAGLFRAHGIIEALSMVERTPSKVEMYRMFFGCEGVVPLPEGAMTMSNLVARAKEMIEAAAPGAQ